MSMGMINSINISHLTATNMTHDSYSQDMWVYRENQHVAPSPLGQPRQQRLERAQVSTS